MWCPTACRTGALIIFIDRLLFIFIHKNENKCLHVHSQFLKLKNNPCLMDGILSTVENEPMNPPHFVLIYCDLDNWKPVPKNDTELLWLSELSLLSRG